MSIRYTMRLCKVRDLCAGAVVVLLLALSAVGDELRPELRTAPNYDRSAWIGHSLATMDVVVAGTARRTAAERDGDEAARFDVSEVLWGEIPPDLCVDARQLRLVQPYRFQWDCPGVWILLRTAKGYFAMNPTDAPLARSEWQRLATTIGDHRPARPPLETRITENGQLYHVYRDEKSGKETWHGTNVRFSNGVYTELLGHGKRVFWRSWDRAGRLENVINVSGKKGYVLEYYQGHLCKFAHYRNGKKEGVSRTFYRHKPSQLKEEAHWKHGLRHGPTRKWDHGGKLTSDVLYEEAFIAPVVRYRGNEPSRGRIHQSEFGVSYSASPQIMDGLKVGMTTDETSELLKLDFSEESGIRFDFYKPDTYLHVVFKNGRIADRRMGHNGVHLAPRE